MSKLNKRGGFTLAELLIVIAIMAILIAIAIPVFSAQLEKARDAVDEGTARSARSLAEADYLLEHSKEGGTWYYSFTEDTDHNLKVLASEKDKLPTQVSTVEPQCQGGSCTKNYKTIGVLYVLIKDGEAHDNWTGGSLYTAPTP